MVGRLRKIEGFDESRHTDEHVIGTTPDRTRCTYEFTKCFEPFVATKWGDNEPSRPREGVVDLTLGKVRMDFYGVFYQTMKHGRRRRKHVRAANEVGTHGTAREGVLQTVGGQDREYRPGVHRGGNTKPVIRATNRLGGCEYIICERSARSPLSQFVALAATLDATAAEPMAAEPEPTASSPMETVRAS